MKVNEAKPSSVPSDESKATSELNAEPLCKTCRVGRGYRPFLDYVELCPRHAAATALYKALEAFMEPMRRYTKHTTWLKGDEDLLIEAYNNARAALALASTQVTRDTRDNNQTNNSQASNSKSFTPRDTEVVAREVWGEAIAIVDAKQNEYVEEAKKEGEPHFWAARARAAGVIADDLRIARDRIASPDQVVAEEENTDQG